ncbi:MAG TPA: alkaline phosphatase family protein [Bryobacteraceae bacterium]|nr:alkaline phosphatase family protein [Bryobacteraceae bacterium]
MKKQSSFLGKIDHIVVVMMENRSFDHLLGFLYAGSGNVSPLGHPFEGLTGHESNPDGHGGSAPVFRIPATHPHPYFMPGANPGEGYANTNSQLFGTTKPASPAPPASNQGFITNFAYTLNWESQKPNQVLPGTQASDIMGMYTPELLPVLSNLATGYAVCDQWFSSAPTETFPNRAFVAMATSQGFVADKSRNVFTAPSIFTALAKKSVGWCVYGYNAPPLTRGSVADISHAPKTNFGEFPDFQKAAQNGSLASYVFLEPEWGSAGSSQHPNYDMSKGEQFLHDVYYALYGSPVWDSTLLIITYDEHGGCYDHVPPPENAIPPDDSAGEDGFDFRRFGVRVPAVLVSPLIQAGTVFRPPDGSAAPFDHTSILATVEERWGLASLTRRDAAAPPLGGVLTLAQARKDDPLAGVRVPTSTAAPALPEEPDKLEMALAEHASALPLPSEPHGHRHELPAFRTGREAVQYARERYAAFHGWPAANPAAAAAEPG